MGVPSLVISVLNYFIEKKEIIVLKKIKGVSSAKKKTRVLKKSAIKTAIVKGEKMVKPSKTLKESKLRDSKKAGKTVKVKKATAVKKVSAVKSAKATSAVSLKALGTIGLEKQWVRAKKAWVKAIQTEIKQINLTLKQDTKTLATTKADLKQPALGTAIKGKTLSASAKAKAKKSAQVAKLQNRTIAKLQKKVSKAQKVLAQLKQLLLKAQAINKLLSQFDKEWKAPVAIAKPKKAEKANKATKAPKKTGISHRTKKMKDVIALELDVSEDEKAEDTATAAMSEAEAA